jgi:sulfate permease, SulP family
VEANVKVDFTAPEAVEAVRAELARAGTVFALVRVKQDLLAGLESFGLADKIGKDRLFPTLATAAEARAPGRGGKQVTWMGTWPGSP